MLSNKRITILLLILTVTYFVLNSTDTVTKTPILKPLELFPQQIGKWTLVKKHSLSAPIIEKLGTDDYIDYVYASPHGNPFYLYVSYFGAVGVTGSYHSPKNCLPGGGWKFTDIRPLKLHIHQSGPRQVSVNLAFIQNRAEKQLMIYWFQNRGRIIASEYWEKIYLVIDSIFKRRRDGSFIRILTTFPENNSPENDPEIKEFVGKTLAALESFLPGHRLQGKP